MGGREGGKEGEIGAQRVTTIHGPKQVPGPEQQPYQLQVWTLVPECKAPGGSPWPRSPALWLPRTPRQSEGLPTWKAPGLGGRTLPAGSEGAASRSALHWGHRPHHRREAAPPRAMPSPTRDRWLFRTERYWSAHCLHSAAEKAVRHD